MGLLILAGVLVAAGVAGVTVLAMRIKRRYAESNEVVPGRATSAPPEWAGAHTPEARLHRRLIDAVAALRAHPLLDEGSGRLEARVSLEEEIVAVDEQLVAVAALPEPVRADPLARLQEQVAAIERAVAAIAGAGAGVGETGAAAAPAALEQQAADLTDQLDDLARTRAELDAMPASEPDAGESLADPG